MNRGHRDDAPGSRSARNNWTAFQIDNRDALGDLQWLTENRYLSVVDNQCRLSLPALSALAEAKKAVAAHLYGLCDAVLGCIETLVRQQPPQPGQRFDVELIAGRMPPHRPQDIQELLVYFYNTDVLVPTGGKSFWAPKAVTLGGEFVKFVGKGLDDVVQVLWDERERNAQLLQPQMPPCRNAPHKILDDLDHTHEDPKRPGGALGHDDLLIRAKAFFLKRFAGSLLGNSRRDLINTATGKMALSYGQYLGFDFNAGVKLRGAAIEDLGKDSNHIFVAQVIEDAFRQADRDIGVTMGNPSIGMPAVSNVELPFSKRVLVYTNRVHAPLGQISSVFMQHGVHIQVVSEEELFRTVFVSYGGTDAEIAAQINEYLTTKGIKTWFFPIDAVPGQKLHRVMHDGVNSHDRVLLLCSKESLARSGVLNELERVLEREAKESGSDILIPVALDDYVFQNWAPSRSDIASQVRSRVIAKISSAGTIKPNEPNAELDKLVDALSVGK